MRSKIMIIISLIIAIISLTIVLIEVIRRPSVLWRWDWEIIYFEIPKYTIAQDDSVEIDAIIENKGRRLFGTVYVVMKVYELYSKRVIFNSNDDLTYEEKCAFSVADLPKGGKRRFSYRWSVPQDIGSGIYRVVLELWSPHLLHNGPRKYRFYSTNWSGGKDFQVITTN